MIDYIDEDDRQLLADKLINLTQISLNLPIDKYFQQCKDLFLQFDFNFKFSTDLQFDDNNINFLSKDNFKNILLCHLDDLGDTVLATGYIRELRKNFPDSYITYVCSSTVASFLEYCPYLDKIIPFDMKHHSQEDIINFCKDNIWNVNYNLAINLSWEYNSTSTLMLLYSGSEYRISYKLNMYEKYCSDLNYDRNMYNHADLHRFFLTHVIDSPFDMFSEAERKFWILSALNLPVTDNSLEVWYKNVDINHLLQQNTHNKRIVIGLGGSKNRQKYPPNKWIEVLKEINKIDNTTFYLTGINTEKEAADLIEKAIPNCINLVNKTSINELILLINKCDLYLGHDTGIMHIATALKKPVLVLSREGIDKETDHPGSLSSYARFQPYYGNEQIPYKVIRPEYSLDDCAEYPFYGSCREENSHCIASITIEEIIKNYKLLNKKIATN